METPPVVHSQHTEFGITDPREPDAEHYCTLFDVNYLPQALTLYTSLTTHDRTGVMWALCMDEESFLALDRLGLDRLELIRLQELEARFGDDLVDTKRDRTRGEYCWTLTPFLPGYVLDVLERRAPNRAHRVTYLDADCYFFSTPQRILDRFAASGAHVLITPHAYSPEYDQSEKAGVFCVQFLTVRNTEQGRAILGWWQSKCIEWCYSRYEQGRFGDQKYLDEWPTLFDGDVYVLDEPRLTLAPWNVEQLRGREAVLASSDQGAAAPADVAPCLYHFHGLKFLSAHRLELYFFYRLSSQTISEFYDPYVRALESSLASLKHVGHDMHVARRRYTLGERYSRLVHALRGQLKTARIRY